MTGTRPAFGVGSLSFSVKRQGTVSTSRPLCASAIRARQQNGLKRRSASTPARSYIVIGMTGTRLKEAPHYDPSLARATTTPDATSRFWTDQASAGAARDD